MAKNNRSHTFDTNTRMGKGLNSDAEVSGSSHGGSLDEIFFLLFSDRLTLTNAN